MASRRPSSTVSTPSTGTVRTASCCCTGRAFRRGHRLDSSYVLDVFPTVLALLGLPLPADAGGRVLDDAFEAPPGLDSESGVATYRGAWQPVDTVGGPDVERTRQEIERLKAMGYL